mmetsp:Transcript_26573/g.63176  ORF Transcript_26573/g.63176 Transcript_26573/m.63176 type:complete len:92 (-) Transcript_26573:239-514(-)
MRPERSSVDQVRARLTEHKPTAALQPKDQKQKMEDLDARIERLRKEDEKRREEKRNSKLQRREAEAKKNAQFEAPELADMGLPVGFGSSKK